MAVVLSVSCTDNTKMQNLLENIPESTDLVFLCCIPSKWTIIFDDLSHFAIFLSLLEHETPCKCPFGHLLSHIKQQTIGSNFY